MVLQRQLTKYRPAKAGTVDFGHFVPGTTNIEMSAVLGHTLRHIRYQKTVRMPVATM